MKRRLRRYLAHTAVSRCLRYPVDRLKKDGYIIDVQDADVWRRKAELFNEDTPEDGLDNMLWAMSADATDTKGHSLTPVIMRLMNLSPWVRDRMALMHMSLLLPRVLCL